jgi:hypothetical protein
MSQPEWKCVANLGDVNPIDHGGFFVFVDKTGHYAPEVEILEVPDEDSEKRRWTVYRFCLEDCTFASDINPPDRCYFTKDEMRFIHRKAAEHGSLPYREMVTALMLVHYKRPIGNDVNRGWYITAKPGEMLDSPGVLSENAFHPTNAAWFNDDLDTLAEQLGVELVELVHMFVGDDPIERARAWREVAAHWGAHELDHDPLTLTKREVEKRYKNVPLHLS